MAEEIGVFVNSRGRGIKMGMLGGRKMPNRPWLSLPPGEFLRVNINQEIKV